MRKEFFTLIFSFLYLALSGQTAEVNISVHDPVMIRQDSTYYLFCTGRGITVWSSKDMIHWQRERPVFESAPPWAAEAVPGFKNHIWAPDISYHEGKYYLYYSVSAFGKNTSCIGLVTNTTLNPQHKNYRWVDQGKILQSIPGTTNWNAIDPNLVTDKSGRPYLAFGSFWRGLQLAKLKPDRSKIAASSPRLITIASRKTAGNQSVPSADAGTNAIEAPFIFRKNNYYYLFASIDYCCKGPESTYKIIVGRSKRIKGPYRDQKGIRMTKGGGTLLLQGDKDWYGVGHNAVYTFDSADYLIFHGYGAADSGKAKLRIEKLTWTAGGWPQVANSKN